MTTVIQQEFLRYPMASKFLAPLARPQRAIA